DGTRIGINTLTRRDKKCQINNKKPHYIYEKYSIRLSQLSPLLRQIFENLLADDLIMGRINFLLESCNNNFLFGSAACCIPVVTTADCHLMIKNIIVLEPAEVSKFSYIVGWVIYKLIKSDDLTQSHPQFNSICAHLEVLSLEKVVYERHIRSQTTNVISGQEFLDFNNFISEKGSSSLRENLKGMYNDTQTSPKIDKKLMLIKKTNIPMDPLLGLKQLQIWAQLDGAEEVFSRIFLVSELQWLLWAFGDSATKKRKKNLISSILNHLQKGT
ncbi:22126_t:CDS:2, partial [Gigaspora margarita]